MRTSLDATLNLYKKMLIAYLILQVTIRDKNEKNHLIINYFSAKALHHGGTPLWLWVAHSCLIKQILFLYDSKDRSFNLSGQVLFDGVLELCTSEQLNINT